MVWKDDFSCFDPGHFYISFSEVESHSSEKELVTCSSHLLPICPKKNGKYYCFIVTSWDLLMYTTDYYGFSVQGEKKVFRDFKNLWGILVRLIILIPSARNDALD